MKKGKLSAIFRPHIFYYRRIAENKFLNNINCILVFLFSNLALPKKIDLILLLRMKYFFIAKITKKTIDN